jgi:probable rRNA maturation factor
VISVVVEDANWRRAEPRAAQLAKAAAIATLDEDGQSKKTVAVLLADDARLRALNAQFRGKDASTNVLAFPAPPTARDQLGDIALAFGVCAREAADQGKDLSAHLQHLVAHGVLHLLGYDHDSDADAEVMEAKERRILGGLGVADPYG